MKQIKFASRAQSCHYCCETVVQKRFTRWRYGSYKNWQETKVPVCTTTIDSRANHKLAPKSTTIDVATIKTSDSQRQRATPTIKHLLTFPISHEVHSLSTLAIFTSFAVSLPEAVVSFVASKKLQQTSCRVCELDSYFAQKTLINRELTSEQFLRN